MKLPAIIILSGTAALLAACAQGPAGTESDADLATTTIFNVTTFDGDRVNVRIKSDPDVGFRYRALIRSTTSPDTDSVDRQQILAEAVKAVMVRRCGLYDHPRPVYSSDVYEETGVFTCK